MAEKILSDLTTRVMNTSEEVRRERPRDGAPCHARVPRMTEWWPNVGESFPRVAGTMSWTRAAALGIGKPDQFSRTTSRTGSRKRHSKRSERPDFKDVGAISASRRVEALTPSTRLVSIDGSGWFFDLSPFGPSRATACPAGAYDRISRPGSSWSGELRRADRVFDTDPASPSYGKLKQDGRKLYEYDERGVLVNFTCAAASCCKVRERSSGASVKHRPVGKLWRTVLLLARRRIVNRAIVRARTSGSSKESATCRPRNNIKRKLMNQYVPSRAPARSRRPEARGIVKRILMIMPKAARRGAPRPVCIPQRDRARATRCSTSRPRRASPRSEVRRRRRCLYTEATCEDRHKQTCFTGIPRYTYNQVPDEPTRRLGSQQIRICGPTQMQMDWQEVYKKRPPRFRKKGRPKPIRRRTNSCAA